MVSTETDVFSGEEILSKVPDRIDPHNAVTNSKQNAMRFAPVQPEVHFTDFE